MHAIGEEKDKIKLELEKVLQDAYAAKIQDNEAKTKDAVIQAMEEIWRPFGARLERREIKNIQNLKTMLDEFRNSLGSNNVSGSQKIKKRELKDFEKQKEQEAENLVRAIMNDT